MRRASAVLFAPAQVALVSGSTQPLSVNLFGVQRNGLGDPQVTSGHPLAGPDQVVVDSKAGRSAVCSPSAVTASMWWGRSTTAQ